VTPSHVFIVACPIHEQKRSLPLCHGLAGISKTSSSTCS